MWEWITEVDESSEQPLFLQIAHNIIKGIQKGSLTPQMRLPGSRSLARRLGVHRNTVLVAYEELASQGWLHMEPARGTYVSNSIPLTLERETSFDSKVHTGRSSTLGFPMYPIASKVYGSPPEKDVLILEGGRSDLRSFPLKEFTSAYRRVLQRKGPALLDYGDPSGYLPLRKELAKMLNLRRGLPCQIDDIFLTRGAQMGLMLTAQALLRPGDIVAVEAYGYQPAWMAFRACGAHLHPIPTDEKGVQVDALEQLLQHQPIRAMYVTPHHQYPTLAVLSPERRVKLLALAQKHQFAIIEDDYDHEFHYEGHPILPLASMDESGVVLYVGSLSKVFAAGLRIGYVVAPPPFLNAIQAIRLGIDRQGSQAEEAAIAELIAEGEVQRYIRKMRIAYLERRDVLSKLLETTFGDQLSFQPPQGGMAIWVQVDASINTDRWSERAQQEGVLFSAGRKFDFLHQAQPYIRLGFAHHTPNELQEAVKRMYKAL